MNGPPTVLYRPSSYYFVNDHDYESDLVCELQQNYVQTNEVKCGHKDSDNSTNIWQIPVRANVGVLVFLTVTISNMMRSNLSMTILAMVQTNQNGSAITLPDYGPRYLWTPLQQSSLLSAFFYGSTASVIPAGVLIDKYGYIRSGVFLATFFGSILELATPFAASCSFSALFIVRLLIGLLHGCLFPAAFKLFSHWSPLNEMGKFTLSILASNLGSVLSWSLTGYVIESSFGWKTTHYLYGSGALFISMVWLLYVYDSPGEHPWIGTSERTYIESSRRRVATVDTTWAPIRSFATSVPVLSLFLLMFGNIWGVFMFGISAPKFTHEVLGFHLGRTGLIASIPNILRCIVALLTAILGDSIVGRLRWELIGIRRVFCVFSHIIPGLLLIALAHAIHSPYLSVVLLAASYGLNGSVSQSVYVNYHDLTPNHAASLMSITSGIGSLSGLVTPLVVAYFTENENSIEGWQNLYVCGAIIYILPALVFICFGSATVQRWDNSSSRKHTGLCDNNLGIEMKTNTSEQH